MVTMRSASGRGGLAVLLLLALACTGSVRAADDKSDWRKKALELNLITGEAATDGQLEAMRKDPSTTRKLLEAAGEMAKDRKKQPFNSNATYILARAAEDLKLIETSQEFYELQIEQITNLGSTQKLALAYWGMIKMLIDNGKVPEALKAFQKYQESEGDENADRLKGRVERLMTLALARSNHSDEALKLVERKLKRNPNNWGYLDIKAQVLREAGQLDQAAKVYEGIMESVSKANELSDEQKEDLIDECRYALSSLYVDLKQIDKAADQLKALVNKKPESPTYNNDLGFIWADNDMNLEESEKLIRKALENDRKLKQKADPDKQPAEIKDNASFLDSLGWVLFKQKKLKEAKVELQKAVKQEEGQNIEIYDHLGDCLMALGEKAEALAAWKKGLETTTTTKRDISRRASVEKKVKDAK
jgi:tetratricopeptide (TPR) repeat protein